MRKRENVVGNRYGRLTVIEDAEPYIWREKKNRMEKCLCDCGNIVFCQLSALKCGLTNKLRKDAEEKYYGEFRRKEQENDPAISNP